MVYHSVGHHWLSAFIELSLANFYYNELKAAVFITMTFLLALEWEQSSGRVQLLRDDDCQSLVEGEWRKINMLSQYKVIMIFIILPFLELTL